MVLPSDFERKKVNNVEDMKNMDWESVEEIEDSLLLIECGNCHFGMEHSDEYYDCCPVCGSGDLIIETCHEGRVCDMCRHIFDMWESIYQVAHNNDTIEICSTCFHMYGGDN